MSKEIICIGPVVMCTSENEALADDIVGCINKRIKSHNLSPEQGAQILLELAHKALKTLAWLPQSKQAAIVDIESAIKWINT
jgi:hypothetical protein